MCVCVCMCFSEYVVNDKRTAINAIRIIYSSKVRHAYTIIIGSAEYKVVCDHRIELINARLKLALLIESYFYESGKTGTIGRARE